MTFSVIVIFCALATCCSALPSPGSAELWLGNGTDLFPEKEKANYSSPWEGLLVTDNTPTTEIVHTMYDSVRNVVYLSAAWAIQQVEWPRGVLTTAAIVAKRDALSGNLLGRSYGLLLLGRRLFIARKNTGEIITIDLAQNNTITVFAGFRYLAPEYSSIDRSLFITNCPKIPSATHRVSANLDTWTKVTACCSWLIQGCRRSSGSLSCQKLYRLFCRSMKHEHFASLRIVEGDSEPFSLPGPPF